VDGKLKPEWLKLYQDFPDRFIIGSDQHFDPPATCRWRARSRMRCCSISFRPPAEKDRDGKRASSLSIRSLTLHRSIP